MSKLVKIAAIDPHPDADLFPHDEEHVARLAGDIKERGIQTPLHLYPNGDRFTLLAGHDRLEAARRAGLDEVPADMRSMLSTEAKRFEHFVKDNVMRKDVDKRAITKAVWFKYPDSKVQEIADIAGVSLDTSYNARNMAMEERPELFAAEKLTGEDGKARPRQYTPREPKTNGSTPAREDGKGTVAPDRPPQPHGAEDHNDTDSGHQEMQDSTPALPRAEPEPNHDPRPEREVVTRRPYTAKLRAFVRAAMDLGEPTDEEVEAIPTNDMMLDRLTEAYGTLGRILNTHGRMQ